MEAAPSWREPYSGSVPLVSGEIASDITLYLTESEQIPSSMGLGVAMANDESAVTAAGFLVQILPDATDEEISIVDGAVEPANFDGYPLLGMDRTPEIDVVLLESGDTPTGMGEPPIGPVAAAVANAFFNAKGVRLRRIPFTPARVLAALES